MRHEKAQLVLEVARWKNRYKSMKQARAEAEEDEAKALEERNAILELLSKEREAFAELRQRKYARLEF